MQNEAAHTAEARGIICSRKKNKLSWGLSGTCGAANKTKDLVIYRVFFLRGWWAQLVPWICCSDHEGCNQLGVWSSNWIWAWQWILKMHFLRGFFEIKNGSNLDMDQTRNTNMHMYFLAWWLVETWSQEIVCYICGGKLELHSIHLWFTENDALSTSCRAWSKLVHLVFICL